MHLYSYRFLAAYIVVLSSLSNKAVAIASYDGPPCKSAEVGGPFYITPACIDPIYSTPIILSQTDEQWPTPHHLVNGHFNGTDVSFNIYLPPKPHWHRRFFQVVYPLQTASAISVDIGSALYNGGYLVQAAGAGGGYRGDAAAAKFAKEAAQSYYDTRERVYGYILGASAGSIVATSAIENSIGVWDGGIPIVQMTPATLPHLYGIRSYASFVILGKADLITDAIKPGGDLRGAFSQLNAVEQAVAEEAISFGLPLPACENPAAVEGLFPSLNLEPILREADLSYKDDFWSLPGYVGTEASALGDYMRAARVVRDTSITAIKQNGGGGAEVTLDTSVANAYGLPDLNFVANSTTFSVTGSFISPNTVAVAAFPAGITEGSPVTLDNSWFLAHTTYHRHQIPTSSGFVGFDQFLDSTGSPLYPQRPVRPGEPFISNMGGGVAFTGNLSAPIIVISNLVDSDAGSVFPDWYRKVVSATLGDRFDDNYRLWYTEHADHFNGPIEKGKEHYLVDFTGVYWHAAAELSEWVEKGKAPSRSTGYIIENGGQVVVSQKARTRGAVQAIVSLDRGGSDRVVAAVGDAVTLTAHVSLPKHGAPVVEVGWDWFGSGNFTSKPLEAQKGGRVEVRDTYMYAVVGTYFPNVRVTTQRDGDAETEYLRVYNLGRARVVVE
ncbi:hypothetical protein V493_03942 [Pseudogymnoascus sp. VKM F-4281 (FW-2241)]|nr:hypothetical protein V493_03942 [Pseudogymnoascus sp. VKM F-4281 (FW-2241)]